MRIDRFEFPEDLYYDRQHGWGRVVGNRLVQGLTDFGQTIARQIVFVEIPRLGRQVQQGQTFTSLESGKWVGRLPALASGTIAAANEALEDEPELVNDSPYEDGWIAQIEMSDPAELDKLMRADTDEFRAFIEQEMQKHAKLLGKQGSGS
ncbi:MAG: glycine cleavage system protein H [Chloroflexota bacterium]